MLFYFFIGITMIGGNALALMANKYETDRTWGEAIQKLALYSNLAGGVLIFITTILYLALTNM